MNLRDVGKGVLEALAGLTTTLVADLVGGLVGEGWRWVFGPKRRSTNRNPPHAEWCEGPGRFCNCVCLCEHTAPQHKRAPPPGARLPECLGMFTCDCER